ncbi:hypothetical protein [Alkalinema sp. FACHB-956]|uniref:hypothetical protein n=1 Tax=Alkalinema sp. FACHB-956 TaxID=2692768 RepID=UPI001683FBA4|nr:hypothetical protein [Alkalinema sp. FACHB-956]MBD2327780.1 hypothetical protein [Alkalinema sp. FACHB-956]
MKNIPARCQELTQDRRIVFREKRSQITFVNAAQVEVLKIKVDGCVVCDGETLRCDFALVPDRDVEIYVELKGSDVAHAVEQLKSTIGLISEDPKRFRKLCFVISTRVPRQGTDLQNWQVAFKKLFNAKLQVRSGQAEVDLGQVVG